jgi:hypothetical protein
MDELLEQIDHTAAWTLPRMVKKQKIVKEEARAAIVEYN